MKRISLVFLILVSLLCLTHKPFSQIHEWIHIEDRKEGFGSMPSPFEVCKLAAGVFF